MRTCGLHLLTTAMRTSLFLFLSPLPLRLHLPPPTKAPPLRLTCSLQTSTRAEPHHPSIPLPPPLAALHAPTRTPRSNRTSGGTPIPRSRISMPSSSAIQPPSFPPREIQGAGNPDRPRRTARPCMHSLRPRREGSLGEEEAPSAAAARRSACTHEQSRRAPRRRGVASA